MKGGYATRIAASLVATQIWPTSKPPAPPRAWRLLYLARAASVSVTAARATLLTIISHLLLDQIAGVADAVNLYCFDCLNCLCFDCLARLLIPAQFRNGVKHGTSSQPRISEHVVAEGDQRRA